jgi:hypothetical protein
VEAWGKVLALQNRRSLILDSILKHLCDDYEELLVQDDEVEDGVR